MDSTRPSFQSLGIFWGLPQQQATSSPDPGTPPFPLPQTPVGPSRREIRRVAGLADLGEVGGHRGDFAPGAHALQQAQKDQHAEAQGPWTAKMRISMRKQRTRRGRREMRHHPKKPNGRHIIEIH